MVAFDTAKIENRDIHETKPFVPDIKTEHIPAIPIGNIRKRHFLTNTPERKAIFPELFNIHTNNSVKTTLYATKSPRRTAPEIPCKTGPDRPE